MRIAALVFPRLTQLDLAGPYEVFSRVPEVQMMLVAKSLEPVRSEYGLPITPTSTFADTPQADVLFCPGGQGVNEAMLDDDVLAFVRTQAGHARYITSVCTGALLLGAAGLLDGYRATTHWTAMEFLPLFGAIPVEERVVCDRNRITGGGVTAGIDFALFVLAEVSGEDVARFVQLAIEYDPHPPFAGHPRGASDGLVASVKASRARAHEQRRQAVHEAARRLGKLTGSAGV